MKQILFAILLCLPFTSPAQDYSKLPYSYCWAATTTTTAQLTWEPMAGTTYYSLWQFVLTPGTYGTTPKLIAKVPDTYFYIEGLKPNVKYKIYIAKNDGYIGSGQQCLFRTKPAGDVAGATL